mgnify:CR=1 FL=1
MDIIKAMNLKKYYTSDTYEVRALDGVSLTVEEGEFIAVVGTSGCGKTTLMNILGGLDTPDFGGVWIRNTSLKDLNKEERTIFRRRNIGFVFQNYSLIKHLRVWENIELPLLYAKKSFTAKQRHEIITGLLKSVGLESKENDYPINLSGGEQQRVAIARALAVSPEAILCDEPTGALDKKTGKQIMDLLHQVVLKNGIMLLIVTHDLDIAKTCNTIFEMDGGRLQCVKYDS